MLFRSVRDAHTLAIGAAGDPTTPEERRALVTAVDALLEQLVAVGNRQYDNTYIFSGHQGGRQPFELLADGVLYRGDDGRLMTILDSDLSQDSFTLSGKEVFRAVSSSVAGFRDLDPRMTAETRIKDLNGAAGNGVKLGTIVVTSGNQQIPIDLSGADTIGDVITILNDKLPAGVSAVLAPEAIHLVGGPEIAIDETPGGQTATDLGIRTDGAVSQVIGLDLDPRVTERTNLRDLIGGAGVDLTGGLTIRNGSRAVTFNFSTAGTVEDVLNAINKSDTGVWARVAADGKRLEVFSRVSGAPLSIEENGGSAATQLGIRSMYGGRRLAALNDGTGIATVGGNDLRISTASGLNIDVDLDALDLSKATLADVLALINTAGGGAVTASLATQGNGIVITDNTTGGGALRITRLNLSPAIDGLGLNVEAQGNRLVGRDVNPIITDSAFTGLRELRQALDADDSNGISRAAVRLKRVLDDMQEVQGRLASKARGVLERELRVDGELASTQVLLSDVRDVDFTEAIVSFQKFQLALQANLATGSRAFDLSLIDFLR